MAAIALVQDQQAAASATTTVTVTLPGTATTGNLLVAVCSYRSDKTLTTPSGFTLAKDQQNSNTDTTHQDVGIFWKVSDGTETAVVFTINSSGNVAGWVGEYSPTTGSTWVSPVDQTGGAQGTNESSQTSASITTTHATEVVVLGCGYNDAGSGVPASRNYASSYTEQGFANNGTNNAIAAAHLILSSTATTSCALTWTNQCHANVATASFFDTVAGNPPVNTVAPVASGTATVGQTLSTTNGTWTGDATISFTYQWQRDTAGNLSFANIGSATSSTYALVDADDGNKVRCVVTGTNASGNSTGNSNALGLVIEPVPTNSVAPAVTGTTTVGQTLSCTTGTWANQGGSVHTYAYQWKRDAQGSGGYSSIGSATSATYALVNADDACHIKCTVTATNTGGAGTPTDSNIVGVVVEPVPTNSVVPAVSGTTTVGQTLTSTSGTWANQGGTIATYAYKWQDSANGSTGWSDIASATSSTYVIGAGESSKYLRSSVIATNTGGASSAAVSLATAQIGAAATHRNQPVPQRRRPHTGRRGR